MKTRWRIILSLLTVLMAFLVLSVGAFAEDVTWNPNDKGSDVTLSNNNLTASSFDDSYLVRATIGKTTGRWYWEVYPLNNVGMIGISNSSAPTYQSKCFNNTNARYYFGASGRKYPDATVYGDTFSTGDVIGVALDLDNGTLTFYKNGVSQGTAFSDIQSLGEVFPTVCCGSSSSNTSLTANFGATPFEYTPPEGYLPYNLSPPAAPSNLFAEAGDAQVTLNWDSVSEATSYNVKRATTSGGSYETISSEVYGTSYTDTGVTNGTTYYYVVTAVAIGGESPNSNEVFATPIDTSSDITLDIEADNYQLTGNTEFDTYVVIDGADNIYAEDIMIQYDTTLFEYLGAQIVDPTGMGIYYQNDATVGTARYIVASKGVDYGVNGNAQLLKLTFKTKNVSGQGEIQVLTGQVADGDGNEFDAACSGKTFTISPAYSGGDVNKDGAYTLGTWQLPDVYSVPLPMPGGIMRPI